MPKQKRIKTEYPGVYYIVGKSIALRKPERIYYINYRKNGKRIEEKAGRQFQDGMTPAKANRLRAYKMEGKVSTNQEIRIQKKTLELKIEEQWTISNLWCEYKRLNPNLKGIRTDNNRFIKDIEPVFGNKEPKQISPTDIANFKLILLKRIKPQTVKNTLELIRRIANFGYNKQLTERLNFKIEMPKNINNEVTEELQDEELIRLLKVLDDEPNIIVSNLMKLALFSGMRRGELFNLQWKDIKFDRGHIILRNTKSGKNKTIPINNIMRKILENHPRMNSPYVFPGRGGKRRTDITKHVNRIKEKQHCQVIFAHCMA